MEKLQIKRVVKVLCGNCNSVMKIEEWGLYEFWLLVLVDKNINRNKIKNYPAPHRNRSHDCNICGTMWLSSDFLELIDDNKKEIVYKFMEVQKK